MSGSMAYPKTTTYGEMFAPVLLTELGVWPSRLAPTWAGAAHLRILDSRRQTSKRPGSQEGSHVFRA